MSKQGGSTDVMPMPRGEENHPRGLFDAISLIESAFAQELGGCLIKKEFLNTKQKIEFFEVGMRSALVSGLVTALLTPLALGVIEKFIPIFGSTTPTAFDQFFAFMLAVGFSLGYACFLARTATCYIGGYTKSMISNLLGGIAAGGFVKALVAFIAFHFMYLKVLSDKNILWAAGKLYSFKLSQDTVAAIYQWVLEFRGVFLTSAWFVVATTAVFVMLPFAGMAFAAIRNRKLIAAGIVNAE